MLARTSTSRRFAVRFKARRSSLRLNALAALNLIGEEVVEKEPELIISMVEALGQVVGVFFAIRLLTCALPRTGAL